MSDTSSDTLLEFPCSFPIKIMGRNDDQFIELVRSLVLPHYPALSDDNIETKLSRNDKYLAITATIEATSKGQLDAIYQSLSDHPDVLIVL